MTAEAHLGVVWIHFTFSSIGLCLSLWKGHFVEMWYQLTSMIAQLCFCIQVVNSLRALLWELCGPVSVLSQMFLQTVDHLHFLHLCVPYTRAVTEESGIFQMNPRDKTDW